MYVWRITVDGLHRSISPFPKQRACKNRKWQSEKRFILHCPHESNQVGKSTKILVCEMAFDNGSLIPTDLHLHCRQLVCSQNPPISQTKVYFPFSASKIRAHSVHSLEPVTWLSHFFSSLFLSSLVNSLPVLILHTFLFPFAPVVITISESS